LPAGCVSPASSPTMSIRGGSPRAGRATAREARRQGRRHRERIDRLTVVQGLEVKRWP
jgi:hypothetical protein